MWFLDEGTETKGPDKERKESSKEIIIIFIFSDIMKKIKKDIEVICCMTCGYFKLDCDGDDVTYGSECDEHEQIGNYLGTDRGVWYGLKMFDSAEHDKSSLKFSNPGFCYDSALKAILNIKNPDIKYVLGVANKTAHAWLEDDENVFDVTFAVKVPKKEFYEKMNVTHNHGFSRTQVIEKMIEQEAITGSVLPSRWDEVTARMQKESEDIKRRLNDL